MGDLMASIEYEYVIGVGWAFSVVGEVVGVDTEVSANVPVVESEIPMYAMVQVDTNHNVFEIHVPSVIVNTMQSTFKEGENLLGKLVALYGMIATKTNGMRSLMTDYPIEVMQNTFLATTFRFLGDIEILGEDENLL